MWKNRQLCQFILNKQEERIKNTHTELKQYALRIFLLNYQGKHKNNFWLNIHHNTATSHLHYLLGKSFGINIKTS